MFIDIHCHILPGVDDGADSFDDSLDIIRNAHNNGTTIMVATPHYNNISQGRPDEKKAHILDKYRLLKELVAESETGVSLFLGSELLVDKNFGMLHKADELITINGTRYLLVEFSFNENIHTVKNYIDEIISYGYIPIIAHPERYNFFSNSHDDILDVLSKGCLFQINKGSPLKKHGEAAYKLSNWLLKNDMVHFIACDSHGVSHRNADMSELYEFLIENYSASKIKKWVHDNPKRVLLDMNIN